MNPATLSLDTNVLDLPWEAVPLRMLNALSRNNIHTVADLVSISAEEVARMRGVGPKSVDALVAYLAQYGLSLAPNQDGVPWRARALPPVLADLAEAKWIGHQLDVISADHRAQPTRSFLAASREIPQIEKRRYAWRMFRWATGRTEEWPDMDKRGAAWEVYPLPGSVEAHLAGLNRLAHEELGDE